MIAQAKPIRRKNAAPAWHAAFLLMLPAIQRHARIAFRDFPDEAREDLVQEAVANCLVAYVRLVELGKPELAYPTPRAMYAVRQVHSGRRVGSRLNVRDVTSPHARLTKGITVERLDRFDGDAGEWLEILVEDKRATPADTAAIRIDFAAWLQRLSDRDRQIAEALAVSQTTNEVARRFRLSPGRISQKRREYLRAWQQFQGEDSEKSQGGPVAA